MYLFCVKASGANKCPPLARKPIALSSKFEQRLQRPAGLGGHLHGAPQSLCMLAKLDGQLLGTIQAAQTFTALTKNLRCGAHMQIQAAAGLGGHLHGTSQSINLLRLHMLAKLDSPTAHEMHPLLGNAGGQGCVQQSLHRKVMWQPMQTYSIKHGN